MVGSNGTMVVRIPGEVRGSKRRGVESEREGDECLGEEHGDKNVGKRVEDGEGGRVAGGAS